MIPNTDILSSRTVRKATHCSHSGLAKKNNFNLKSVYLPSPAGRRQAKMARVLSAEKMLIESFAVRKSNPGVDVSWKLRWQEASRSPTTGCWSSWQPATERYTRTAAAASRPWARPPSSLVCSLNPGLALAGQVRGHGGNRRDVEAIPGCEKRKEVLCLFAKCRRN